MLFFRAQALDGGYNQTYIILKQEASSDAKSSSSEGYETLFRCGNWCYLGKTKIIERDYHFSSHKFEGIFEVCFLGMYQFRSRKIDNYEMYAR